MSYRIALGALVALAAGIAAVIIVVLLLQTAAGRTALTVPFTLEVR